MRFLITNIRYRFKNKKKEEKEIYIKVLWHIGAASGWHNIFYL